MDGPEPEPFVDGDVPVVICIEEDRKPLVVGAT
jgi:hypothetical protein